ncbi:acyl-CoA thioesterase [Roseinatronobacter bogoriensis subsp. barguzinensis]|uniref:Phenylacetic acid degradation protein PaaD n=2 Tax=Roseinatronobacter bogoriensis TaxID=119542 RepID=A0A2K8KCD9_9RHOB|nr:phenylacetic acid degradation protein PaaD [Rhodobaca barguzinensis]MBB4209141.1 acyl-CoA thioesterase [Rhodobaca bogoriensis DSM 18756]TDW36331.1 acyl-CoA thioesterase [Rhodobaca barguzinensis]TDY67541.1 acyl-CoA thioesterase [Rhodobaca bogoriensis DSM 18756]
MTNPDTMTPQALAEASAHSMWKEDSASRNLGMSLDHVAPGEATLSMMITDQMTNGHGMCHGGYIFTLADSAFAFACNTYNQRVVAQHCAVTYLNPVELGARLTAQAREISRRGRSGIYDVRVQDAAGTVIAEFRGHSRVIKGTHLREE